MIPVAGYCRVSTDKADQLNSFEAQQRYFKAYIEQNPAWSLCGIYADEGVSGTSTKNRAQFNRMIHDAHAGKIRLIVTKEVSRFSRNILDTVAFTRELKSIGVGVLFLNDGIFTLDPDAELRLCIMGSVAQEESRRISDRVKWGQTRQMERGVVFGHALLGYSVQHGRLTVQPEEAELVRWIFTEYAAKQKSTAEIARELTAAGQKTHSGRTNWTGSTVYKILRNEKYAGDLVQKKTYTPDYLTHEKKANRGAEEKIILRNHHEPIVDRALWNRVQNALGRKNRRENTGGGCGSRYLFSGKICCGECGRYFAARKRMDKSGNIYRKWACGGAINPKNGTPCRVGWLLREEDALEMLKNVLCSLNMDREALLSGITQDAAARERMRKILLCETEKDCFLWSVLEKITVYKEHTAVLRLKDLPMRWVFHVW